MGQPISYANIDRQKTTEAVKEALEQYRIYKYLTFDAREANTTASYTERFHGPTNVTSDQTANIAIYNVDTEAYQAAYCARIERAVMGLPEIEAFLMEKRYLTKEYDYITDKQVFGFEFDPPISEGKYREIRWRAFRSVALNMKIAVIKGQKEE
ncbi:ArpU family phage packaging/lysis transcriptional regulator [Paenibacillus sp. FSL R7-0026]|uniref:ArpU family phage packaging/lysis transcriptional regulator n=1 Tax=Paenibacillus sp. FSL R7-0026 TaxID=2921668 RepID=UPI0030F925BC